MSLILGKGRIVVQRIAAILGTGGRLRRVLRAFSIECNGCPRYSGCGARILDENGCPRWQFIASGSRPPYGRDV